MLAKYLYWLLVHSVMENLFIKTHCVICFTVIFFHAWFDQWKSRHNVLANLLRWFFWRESNQMNPYPNASSSCAPMHKICFLQLYKIKKYSLLLKISITNINRLLPWYYGVIVEGFLTPPYLLPDSSDQPRLLPRWRCAPTLQLRSFGDPSSSPPCRYVQYLARNSDFLVCDIPPSTRFMVSWWGTDSYFNNEEIQIGDI